jgi:hypothetical protein
VVAGRPNPFHIRQMIFPALVIATACLEGFHGTWRGPGTVLNRAVVMEQQFAPALLARYTEQRMRHLASDSATRPTFEGRAFYRALGPAQGDSVGGTWLDARGVSFGLAGTCSGDVLSSQWLGTERGRTVYARIADTLVVIDSVYPATAPAREFGRSRLVRVVR